MKKNQKKNEGITLIALVVTIIVLLILAGISIQMLTGQNGILNRAAEAKSATEKAEDKEQIELAVSESMVYGQGNIDTATLKTSIERIGAVVENLNSDGTINLPAIVNINDAKYEITSDGKILNIIDLDTASADFQDETIAVIDENGKYFYVPQGFKVLKTEATKIEQGIVIKNEAGNEYVWIPCTLDRANGTLKYQRTEWGVETDGADSTKAFKDELTLLDDNVTYSTTDKNNGIDKTVSTEIVAQIYAEKASISKYGGYYIGRYETTNVSGIAKIMPSQEPYANILWSKAYSLAKGIDVGSACNSYLCSSYSWDTAINFIQNNSTFTKYATSRDETNENWSDFDVLDVKGNKIKESGTSQRLKTGLTTAKLNIYDMGGNVSEYTTELNPGTSETVVLRGGSRYFSGRLSL